MTVASAFGLTIQKIRKDRGISQSELADLCQLDRSFISLLERGRRQPTLTTLFTLSRVLRIPSGEIIRQTERLMKKKKIGAPYWTGARRL